MGQIWKERFFWTKNDPKERFQKRQRKVPNSPRKAFLNLSFWQRKVPPWKLFAKEPFLLIPIICWKGSLTFWKGSSLKGFCQGTFPSHSDNILERFFGILDWSRSSGYVNRYYSNPVPCIGQSGDSFKRARTVSRMLRASVTGAYGNVPVEC